MWCRLPFNLRAAALSAEALPFPPPSTLFLRIMDGENATPAAEPAPAGLKEKIYAARRGSVVFAEDSKRKASVAQLTSNTSGE